MPKDKGGLVRASQYPQPRPYTLTNDQRPLFEIVLVCRSFSRNLHHIHRLDTLSLSLWKWVFSLFDFLISFNFIHIYLQLLLSNVRFCDSLGN
ncbi:hypothetical protein GYH30_041989 [Glycine max]|uniref:Uncharacterized protein n=1 Tax=Glycine max TaxID=3847 RepID=A0A0R0G616_SOYBN|nr:hypothetical protein GYH30_041989 [Glycine max]